MNRPSLLLFSVFAASISCQACMTIPPDAKVPVHMTDESALIVWNQQTHTEHFVRRATFQTKAKNFAFLVPTPSKPELGSADDQLFNELEWELQPKRKTIVQRGVDWTPWLFSRSAETLSFTVGGGGAPLSLAVQVVGQKQVGDYNATILKANDTAALLKWLRSHHYPVTADMRNWLAPYVAKGFFVTAFQIGADKKKQAIHAMANSLSLEASAVRLTFKSDAPFYPYQEPKSAQEQSNGRSLRVFFVGDKRVNGQIENESRSDVWPALTNYSAPLKSVDLRKHGMTIPTSPLRLTAFIDASAPRPGWGDLRFVSSRDQSEATPPPYIVYEDKRWWMPLDIAVVAILSLGAMWGIGKKIRQNDGSKST